jgi:hypothetical protein
MDEEQRLITEYVAVDPDAWVRVLPLGTFKRFGRKVEITADKVREMAANFGKVPETTIAVNAEHEGYRGKVADVVEVEARSDGLWARLGNWIAGAAQLVRDGAYQYLSPEVLWGPTDYDGREVSNVLTGLALTNLPYFGKQTALYSLDGALDNELNNATGGDTPENLQEATDMGENQDPIAEVKRAVGIVELLKQMFGAREPEPAEAPPSNEGETAGEDVAAQLEALRAEFNEQLEALKAENAELKTKLDEQDAEAEFSARVAEYGALEELCEGLPQMLATYEDQEKAKAIAASLGETTQGIKAVAAQEQFAALFKEFGGDGHGEPQPTGVDKFNAAVEEAMEKFNLDYGQAADKVGKEHPELYATYNEDLPKAQEVK